jgi:hypothetical protein
VTLNGEDFDRCDRCGTSTPATASVVTGQGPIDLRGHHFQQHKPVITAAGYHVVKVVEAA